MRSEGHHLVHGALVLPDRMQKNAFGLGLPVGSVSAGVAGAAEPSTESPFLPATWSSPTASPPNSDASAPEPALAAVLDDPPTPASSGEGLCKERLGGLFRFYYRKDG
jgi:hypothetical protein